MIRTQERERSLRKIAILFRALDEESADRLLEQMPLDRAAEVRELAEALESVDPQEQEAIVDEFLSATGRAPQRRSPETKSSDEGVELQLSSAARHVTATARSAVTESLPAAVAKSKSAPEVTHDSTQTAKPLAFVETRHAAALAQWLNGEREAIGAVVLSLLEPMIAARTLERIPLERQRVLLDRLSEMARVESAVAEELDGILRVVLGRVDESDEPRPGRSAVQAILSQVQAAHRARILGHPEPAAVAHEISDEAMAAPRTVPMPARSDTISARAPRTSDSDLPTFVPVARFGQAGRPPVPQTSSPQPTSVVESLTPDRQRQLQIRFDRLADWNQDSLVSLLKRVPPRILRLALVGASDRLIDRVTRPLGKAEAKAMRAELERPGAVRLADIAQAQLQILELAERMVAGQSSSGVRKTAERVA